MVYYLGVSSPPAIEAFYRATEQRCDCRCNWTGYPLCPRDPGRPSLPGMAPLACTNTERDDDNCGGCGNKCPPTTRCEEGQCVCDSSEAYIDCGGQCVNYHRDPLHCGGCRRVCGTICALGWCRD